MGSLPEHVHARRWREAETFCGQARAHIKCAKPQHRTLSEAVQHFQGRELPLLEAQQLSMPILAPELDYVRDVVEPNETFNADSPTSMARAVMRHMNIESAKIQPICAAEFLRQIQKQGEA